MKTRFVFKKMVLFFLTLLFILSTVPLVSSCVPELTFGDLLFCESIDSETGEPIDPKDEFGIEIEKIFAIIKVSGVEGEDNYRFTLKNKDTEETIQDITEQYSRKEKGFLEMYVYLESEDLKEDQIILEPGEYTVEFYHKGKLIEDAEFEINKPDAEILEVVLANGINEKYEPVNITDVFGPTDSFYACVKLDYHIAGDNLTAKWYFGEDELIDEISLDLENYYLPGYTTFEMPGDTSYPWPVGDYKVEIYLNGTLHDTYDFEVEGDGTAEYTTTVTFNDSNVYVSEDFGFSIGYPDNWTYEEYEEAGEGVLVTFTPPSQDIFMSITASMVMEGYFESDELEQLADDTITAVTSDGDYEQTGLDEYSGELFGYEYEEFVYTFIDENGIESMMDVIMILKDKDLFMFLGVAFDDSINIATDVFIEMLTTGSFF